MSVYRDAKGRWRYRTVIRRFDGTKVRVNGTPEVNTKLAAQDEERAHITREKNPLPSRKGAITFEEFWPRYVREHLAWKKGRTQDTSRGIYTRWLQPTLGSVALDEVATRVPTLRATVRDKLARREGSDGHKSVNNVTSVVGSVLRFAASVGILSSAPRLGQLPVTRPEMEWMDWEPYGRLIRAAEAEGYPWSVAVLLAGEAGLRVGEVQEVRWREDVDLIAEMLTVQRKNSDGRIEATKGRERRFVPMTPRLVAALRSLSRIREGLVISQPDGTAFTRKEMGTGIARVYRRAGLPVGGWHVLRHSFGTHAAQLGVNPWRLQAWMGHKSIDTTLGYVHLADAHRRPAPAVVLAAGAAESDPDRRIIRMLGARDNAVTNGQTAASEVRVS